MDEKILNDITLMLVFLFFSTVGNIFFCIKNKYKIKPIYIRIMYGLMGIGIYISGYFMYKRQKPVYDEYSFVFLFICGFLSKKITDIIDEKIPLIFEKLIEKFFKIQLKEEENKKLKKKGENYEKFYRKR